MGGVHNYTICTVGKFSEKRHKVNFKCFPFNGKELFTWSLKTQHIALSCNILSMDTKQNTYKYINIWQRANICCKVKMSNAIKAMAQFLEPKLFPECTLKFLKPKF